MRKVLITLAATVGLLVLPAPALARHVKVFWTEDQAVEFVLDDDRAVLNNVDSGACHGRGIARPAADGSGQPGYKHLALSADGGFKLTNDSTDCPDYSAQTSTG
ncbi:MAG: hypothetical protein HY240_09800 [Actinobacteria bacterium]|nr:hypothetical protein [Actinomycetota bacterium]